MTDKLIARDVSVVFGIIGDGINQIEAMRKQQNKIRFITVCHEEYGFL